MGVLGVDGGKGTCSVASRGRGKCCPNHTCGCVRIIAVVKNKTHSNLIRSVGKLLWCGHASCTCLILCRRTGGRHCAFAVVSPASLRPQARHSVFAFGSLRRRRRSSNERCASRTGHHCPFLHPIEKKASLCARLHQLRTCFGIKSSFCVSPLVNGNIVHSNI